MTLCFSDASNIVHMYISGVGSGGAPGAGAPPLFNRAPADLASFPGRFVNNRPGNETTAPGLYTMNFEPNCLVVASDVIGPSSSRILPTSE